MKRWLVWMVLPLLACVSILANRAGSERLLLDSDTAAILEAIRKVDSPMSWFTGDWPLQNHFYRPLSTLTFELDNRLYGNWAQGYGLTNALLAVGCVLGLFWVVRETTDLPWLAGVSALLFGLWQVLPFPLPLVPQICALLACVSLIGVFRRNAMAAIVTAASLGFLASQWAPAMEVGSRITGWLPGRTASTMTLLALIAMASYARFERSRFRPSEQEPTPFDKPATKGTVVVASRERPSWMWLVLSWVGLAGALLCYEQAVMLPFILTAGFVYWRFRRGKPLVWPILVAWGTLGMYLAVRAAVLPGGVSGYQEQQLRYGGGVALSIADYALPGYRSLLALSIALSGGLVILLLLEPWRLLTSLLGNFAIWFMAWRHELRWMALLFFVCSVFAFLPMAWLQPFGHYHYWPSALRSVLVAVLAKVALDGFVSAVSPRAVQAPPRLSPAPGSLPRR